MPASNEIGGKEIIIDIEYGSEDKKGENLANSIKQDILEKLDEDITVILHAGRKKAFEVTTFIRASTHGNKMLKVPDAIQQLANQTQTFDSETLEIVSKHSASDEQKYRVEVEAIEKVEKVENHSVSADVANDPITSLPNIVLHSKISGEGYPSSKLIFPSFQDI